MKKMLKYLPILLLVVFVGCNIITGNKTIVIELDDETIIETTSGFKQWFIDRDDYDTWKDHAEDLKHVVDLGFAVEMFDSSGSDVTATFYVSTDPLGSVSEVIDQATVVLGPITVPAGPGTMKKITWQQSYDYLHNFDKLKELILLGEFYLYAVGVSADVHLTFHKTAVILTINAEP